METHGWAFQVPRNNIRPTSTVMLGLDVVALAAIDGSDAGTTIVPISLPKEVCELPVSEKPRMNAGGILTTAKE